MNTSNNKIRDEKISQRFGASKTNGLKKFQLLNESISAKTYCTVLIGIVAGVGFMALRVKLQGGDWVNNG